MVQYAAVRQILNVFCAYRLLVEERHRQRHLIFYKLVPYIIYLDDVERIKRVVNVAFFMLFADFDPSPLTVCINCSFLHFFDISIQFVVSFIHLMLYCFVKVIVIAFLLGIVLC